MKVKKSGSSKSKAPRVAKLEVTEAPRRPQPAQVSLIDQKTGQQVIVQEPHVIVPVRHLKPGVAISQAWHSSHYPGCWEAHVDCARVRLTELFLATTSFINLFQSIPPALDTLKPNTRHLYAKFLSEMMAAIAKCAFPEMKGIRVPDAEDDLEALSGSSEE